MTEYLPLYAEKRCLVCGFWRGQHIGASTEDVEMLCPELSWYQETTSFSAR